MFVKASALIASVVMVSAAQATEYCTKCNRDYFLGNPACSCGAPSGTRGWAPTTPTTPTDFSGRVGGTHSAAELFPQLTEERARINAELVQLGHRKNQLLRQWNSGRLNPEQKDQVRNQYHELEARIAFVEGEKIANQTQLGQQVFVEGVNTAIPPRIYEVLKQFKGVAGNKVTVVRYDNGTMKVFAGNGKDVTNHFFQ